MGYAGAARNEGVYIDGKWLCVAIIAVLTVLAVLAKAADLIGESIETLQEKNPDISKGDSVQPLCFQCGKRPAVFVAQDGEPYCAPCVIQYEILI